MPLVEITEDFPLCHDCYREEYVASLRRPEEQWTTRQFVQFASHSDGYRDGRGCEKCGSELDSEAVQCGYLEENNG